MTWQIDNSHTGIFFTARHMMVAKVRGQFKEFDGTIDFDPDTLTNTAVNVDIKINSVDTGETQRDDHLRSADFFDVENYPVMNFTSKRVELDDDYNGRLIGELTIKDISQEVTLDVEYTGLTKNPWGQEMAGFSASTTINRKDWNLNWNVALEAGGWLVGDKIKIEIDLELVKVQEQVTETANVN